MSLTRQDSCSNTLDSLVGESFLADVGAPQTVTCRFTHFQGSCNARLRSLHVSVVILGQPFVYRVLPVSFSDHCLVQVGLNSTVRRRLVPNSALWKCNVSVLLDADFYEQATSCLRDVTGDTTTGPLTEWYLFKQEVKNIETGGSGVKGFYKKCDMRALSRSLHHLYELECDQPREF